MNKKLLVLPFAILLTISFFIFGASANHNIAYAVPIANPAEYTLSQVIDGQTFTSHDFVTINSATEFRAFASFVNDVNNYDNVRHRKFKLTTDIVLNENSGNYFDWPYDPPANAWAPIGTEASPFSGIFYGQGFTISGVYIDTAEDYQGLFGYNTGSILDVSTINYYIIGGNKVGGLVGYNDGNVIDCASNGYVRSDSANMWDSLGGIVGTNAEDATILNCYNRSVVGGSGYTGEHCLGGVVGLNYGVVGNCYNAGNTVGGADYKGSIVGYFNQSQGGAVSNCYWLIGTGGLNNKGITDSFDEDGILLTANNSGTYQVTITAGETSLRYALNCYVDYYYTLFSSEEFDSGSVPSIRHWASSPYPVLAGVRTITFYENSGEYQPEYTKPADYLEGTLTHLPTSANIIRQGYTFNGWTQQESEWDETTNPYFASITIDDVGNKVFYAKWTINTYTVIWKVGDTILETDTSVEYGSTPIYNGSTPTKQPTTEYTYTFSGWAPAIEAVSNNITYTAQFSAAPIPTPDPTEPAPTTPIVSPQSNLLWLWVLLSVVGAVLIVLLLLWLILHKRNVRFVLNGTQIGFAKYKLNEPLYFPQDLAKYKWFTNKQKTKPLTKQKMGWLGFTIYTTTPTQPSAKATNKANQ